MEFEEAGEPGEEKKAKKYRIGKACRPNEPDCISSNQTLVKWLPQKILISELLKAERDNVIQKASEKSKSTIYIAYQKEIEVEWKGEKLKIAGRTLEESFALENSSWCQNENQEHLGLRFKKEPVDINSLANKIHKRVSASSFNKTTFALGILGENPKDWNVPVYIKEGLSWLGEQVVVEQIAPAEVNEVLGEIAEVVVPAEAPKVEKTSKPIKAKRNGQKN